MSLTITSDEHTLTFKVYPVVTEDQIHTAIRSTLNTLANQNKEYQCKYIMNMVKKRGVRTGRGFIRFMNSKVYHMLLGRNPDGSSRTRQYEDPNWEPPVYNPFASTAGKSWADIMEEEDELKAPIIEETLPPLAQLPKIKLSEEQQIELEKHFDETLEAFEAPSEVEIYIEAALAHDMEQGLSHNVLRSSSLLPFMDEAFIKNEFQCFSTSKRTVPVRVGNGKKDIIQETFPQVKIVTHKGPRGDERVAYVTFDSSTRDASFAFHMKRHCEFTNNRTKEVYIVNYTYAKSRN